MSVKITLALAGWGYFQFARPQLAGFQKENNVHFEKAGYASMAEFIFEAMRRMEEEFQRVIDEFVLGD